MRSIIKILTTLTLTLFVVVGGGYYFYTLVNPGASNGTFWYEFFFIGEPRQNMELVPNYYENLPSFKTNNRSKPYIPPSNPSLLGSSESSGIGRINSSVANSNLSKYNNFSNRQATGSNFNTSRGIAHKNNVKENKLYGGSTGGVMPYNTYASRGFGRTSGYANNYSSGGAISSISSPLAVPFSNSFTGTPPTTTSGTILFDPGAATTEEIEQNAIPVGDGLWIMLAMAGVYGLLRKKHISSIKIH